MSSIKSEELVGRIEVSSRGTAGADGADGDQPQPFALDNTTIPSGYYWLRASPRLELAKKIIIEADAKLIVV